MAAREGDEGTCHFKRLAPDLIRRVAGFLHINDVIQNLKPVCRETAACLREHYRNYRLVRKPSSDAWALVLLAEHPWPGRDFVAHWDTAERWHALNVSARTSLLCLAASSLHGPSLDVALRHSACGGLSSSVLGAAVASGDLQACERLLHEGCEVGLDAELRAARGGHLHALQWLQQRGMLSKPIHERDVNYIFGAALAASAGGHAHVLAWLEGQVGGDGQWGRPPPSPDWRAGMLAVEAAKAGHIGLLDLLAPRVQPRNRRERYEGHKVLVAIAYGCPLAVLQRYYCQGSHSGGGGAEGGAGGGGTGGEGGSWTGEGPLRGTRARELLSSALASPLADWRQKVQWLLAQCEGCPTAALTALTAPPPPQSRPPITPFEVCGKALVTAPEDASDGANGGKGDGFAARLAAVRALGMTLVFSKGLTPDTWSVWSRNPVQLVLHMLPDTQDAQLRERLLATAAAQRCLPVLQWFQAHEGPGVFTEGHARSALTGLSWSPVHLVHDDDNLLAVLRFFEAVGVLPQPPATAAAAEAEAEAAGDAAAGAAAGGSSQHSAKALAAADVVAAEGAAAGAAGEAVDAAAALRQQWSEALRESVLFGTGLPVLRYLRERCGVHLGVRGLAVAGCSLEALTWALANSPCASGNAEVSGGGRVLSHAKHLGPQGHKGGAALCASSCCVMACVMLLPVGGAEAPGGTVQSVHVVRRIPTSPCSSLSAPSGGCALSTRRRRRGCASTASHSRPL